MDILAALKQEETKLQRELAGIQGAIKALNGRASSTQPARKVVGAKHVMSAAARAKISKATKARFWAATPGTVRTRQGCNFNQM
jgi:hypothetical protein